MKRYHSERLDLHSLRQITIDVHKIDHVLTMLVAGCNVLYEDLVVIKGLMRPGER